MSKNSTETLNKRHGGKSALNAVVRYAQWVPVVGIPVSMDIAMNGENDDISVINNHFWLSAMWHVVWVPLIPWLIFHSST